MSDLSSVTQTRSALARLSAHNPNPDPDEIAAARASLACAKLDNRLRECARDDVQLDDVHAGHLVGLLLSICSVPGDDVIRIEKDVRAAVRAARPTGA
ncbi:hypothetical protein [Nocardioides halotolerans]|uniref:hypothetical protein n=1 Tax=Nocardioides halotolerans TaxID=433660 RepID=UPI0003F525B1|nr:hypothetical protein [Nocardioides halotolerans]